MKARRTFADIAAARKRYDPAKEGYGGPEEWNASFRERMGFEEAERIVSGQNLTPRQILGLKERVTWAEVTTMYRARILENHPDRIASTGMNYEAAVEATKKINAAYAILAKEFGK